MLLVGSEGKSDTNSHGGSHRSLCYRVPLPGHRGLPALVLLPNWGVSTLCSLQLFSTAVCELEGTLFNFCKILIFLLYFVLIIGVLNKRCCLGYFPSFEILLKHFTLKFFRMRCEFPLKVRVSQKCAISAKPSVFRRSVFFSPGNRRSEINQKTIQRCRGAKLLEWHNKNLEYPKCSLVR